MRALFMLIAAALVAAPAYADGFVIFLDAAGSTNISQLALRVIPGTANQTSFRAVAQGGNVSSLAFFSFSPDLNLTVSPANRTLLPDGDYQLVTVTVQVANNTQAGLKVASVFTLTTKPEQRVLPLLVEVPSTTEWNVTPQLAQVNATVNGFGSFNVTLANTGNIPVSGHVSRVDLRGLVFFDDADFTLLPGAPLVRPLYWFVPNITPGTYQARITFVDVLSNARQLLVNITLPDVTAPVINASLDRSDYFPAHDVGVVLRVTDDVNVSDVRYRLDTGNVTAVLRRPDGTYEIAHARPGAGSHTLTVLANDTAGNIASLERPFEVKPYDILNASASIDFLKFKPNQTRTLRLLTALQPADITVTLSSLNVQGQANATAPKILVKGVELQRNTPVNMSVSGDVFIDATGQDLIGFSGTLSLETTRDVRNPAPSVSFRGEIANYSITPAFNISIAGFVSQQMCSPRTGPTYEESDLHCEVDFLPDTPQDQVGVAGSVASLNAEREGQRIRIDACEDDRSVKQLVIYGTWLVFIILAIAYVVKRHYIDQRYAVPGMRNPAPAR